MKLLIGCCALYDDSHPPWNEQYNIFRVQVDVFIISLALKSVAERKSFLIRCLITIRFLHRVLMPSGYLYLCAILICNCHEVLLNQNALWIAISRDWLRTGGERENKIFLFISVYCSSFWIHCAECRNVHRSSSKDKPPMWSEGKNVLLTSFANIII